MAKYTGILYLAAFVCVRSASEAEPSLEDMLSLCRNARSVQATQKQGNRGVSTNFLIANLLKNPHVASKIRTAETRNFHVVARPVAQDSAQNTSLKSVPDAIPESYKCKLCDRKYTCRSGLSRHLRSKHLEEQWEERDHGSRFACNVCNRKCLSSAGLSIHKSKKHRGGALSPRNKDGSLSICDDPAAVYKCKLCNIAYLHRSGLFRHMNTKHLEKKRVFASSSDTAPAMEGAQFGTT